MSQARGDAPHVDVAIIGAGFGGIAMGYRLRRAGFESFAILERADDVGGTWWWNNYPGCQCDIPSVFYSFSFAPNPGWTRTYPLQEELSAYLRACTERFGLLPHVHLRHDVQRATWNDGLSRWEIETSAGPLTARVVVGAQGALSDPRFPDIPGRDSFGGIAFHSARWDHSADLTGKRVAVLGTGASAIQVVPSIQPIVGSLFVFQRTPPWILPHTDRPVPAWQRQLHRAIPRTQQLPRVFAYAIRECLSPAVTRHIGLLSPLEKKARQHLARQVADPELREKLTPHYRLGCKRILPSNRWYPAIQHDNVQVITDGIAAITDSGIRTEQGVHVDLDAIIYATGFYATDLPIAHRIVGREGVPLSDSWRGSPLAYKNTSVPGYPNLFFVHGLTTGYTSMVFMIEAQVNYVLDALRKMRSDGILSVDVRRDRFDAWNADIARRMPPTVWSAGGCSSWYQDVNGVYSTVWPNYTWRFWMMTRRFDLDAYQPRRDGVRPMNGAGADVMTPTAG